MCGYIGSVSFEANNQSKLHRFNDCIICRGPDNLTEHNSSSDVYVNLIFNRLSIVDLSHNANQPMSSKRGSLLMFNGEIYNHRELRKNLESNGIIFSSSHSDSEVILHGLDLYGLKFIDQLRGQFAIFFMNKVDKKIYLIKDRLGQKPLFYHINNKSIYFGSNLKSIARLSNKTSIDSSSVNEYLNLGIVRSPNTIFNDVNKVSPAEIIIIDYSEEKFTFTKHKYWEPEEFIQNKDFNLNEFFNIFHSSVSLRANADVEIASFLSGGLDSTSIVKSLIENNNNESNTFSVAFESKNYDESSWSRHVSKKYGTNHTELRVDKNEINSCIDSAIDSLDEPFADPSVVPSFLLSKLISQNYKVALSGDGGDELLGGYSRIKQSLFTKPRSRLISNSIFNIYPGFLGTGNYFSKRDLNLGNRYRSFLEDQKLLNLLGVSSSLRNNINFNYIKDEEYKALLITDYKFFLSEMMMYKVDRTSMANSLEIRSPFIDHKLIEYVLSHDVKYVDFDKPKSILQDYLSNDFSKEFTNRKKQGFVFDTKEWIYSNISNITTTINDGSYTAKMNPKITNILSLNKSRVNSLRLWKLYVLEKYLTNI
jgi:asparagine synthase (glutamine-hydrolysing)